jgi:hypothetical protein
MNQMRSEGTPHPRRADGYPGGCGVPSERVGCLLANPGFHHGLVCGAPLEHCGPRPRPPDHPTHLHVHAPRGCSPGVTRPVPDPAPNTQRRQPWRSSPLPPPRKNGGGNHRPLPTPQLRPEFQKSEKRRTPTSEPGFHGLQRGNPPSSTPLTVRPSGESGESGTRFHPDG